MENRNIESNGMNIGVFHGSAAVILSCSYCQEKTKTNSVLSIISDFLTLPVALSAKFNRTPHKYHVYFIYFFKGLFMWYTGHCHF